MVANTIGERIVYMREQRNISQLELAKNLQISTSALRNIEKDITEPRLSTLISLSDYFDMSIDYIVNGVSTQEDIKTFRETGLNQAALDALNYQILCVKEWGHLNEYVSMLNEIILEGFLENVLELARVKEDIAYLNEQLNNIISALPDDSSPHDFDEDFDLLKDRRDLIVWRFLKETEEFFVDLIGKTIDVFRDARYRRH